MVVDEAPDRVKVTGMKAIRRQVISHALNQIATARRYAEENETFYEYLNLIVCHMGGGITVGAHAKGRYIDVNNGLDGEGPFSPQRSGREPTGQLIRLCFSGKYTLEELLKLNKGRGGLIDLLGTADFREVERRVARRRARGLRGLRGHGLPDLQEHHGAAAGLRRRGRRPGAADRRPGPQRDAGGRHHRAASRPWAAA